MHTASNTKPATTPNDEIAVAAYLDWLAAGKPTGQDAEFWFRAEERIRINRAPARKSGARKAPSSRHA